MDGERSREDMEGDRARLNGAVDERSRMDEGIRGQRRRGPEDFARGSMDGVPSLVRLFSRGMAVQREHADVSTECYR